MIFLTLIFWLLFLPSYAQKTDSFSINKLLTEWVSLPAGQEGSEFIITLPFNTNG